jgi:hypothetical protein
VPELVLPTFGGVPIFGIAVHVSPAQNAAAVQRDSYFGSDGVFTCFGGTRGWTIDITGCLAGADLPVLLQAEALLLSYGDGVARVLTDAIGRAWPSVIFEGEYRPSREGPKWTDSGVILPYECTFYALV